MFIFNSIDFSNRVKVSDVRRPLLAPQRIASTGIEGKSSEVFHRKNSESYNIDIEFYVFSSTGLQLLSDLRDIAGDLDTSKPAQLIFNDEPDKYVMAIVEDTNIEKNGRHAIVTVSFKILDPYWYAITDDVFNYTTVGAKAFTRKGNAPSNPLVEIEGNSGSYTIEANGSKMTFSGVLNAGEKLIIDSDLLTAYILKSDSSKVSVLNKLDVLDFPVLQKGDNDFTISVADGASLTNCKVVCNSRWK